MFTFISIVCVLQHLLFSVIEPQFRVKPAGVSDVSSFSQFIHINYVL